ncbi:putative hydrolase of the HAD superfamily [Paenibacillus cellulosilyticus]|uniref:Putative hydrolase of the HAD superfamily n=1 Tax=Paenibacillus cellulosilyticus TaxID=375489 RepID=A0A2V2Z002_9BACL|nr:HAD family hydrolase [Paenibacillus cellulosilyticus]PWW07377.1 putative hydrolase of the HAD superfamily [Paenibacillus cellulosilyticus]QKS44454.1 HAD family hydrolase [Paenibacillus cellulosilyticus]
MAELRAIIFDLDETLADRTSTRDRFVKVWIEQYWAGRDHDPEQLHSVFCRLDNNGYRAKDELYHLLVEELTWTDPPTEAEHTAFWQEHFPKLTEPMDNLHNTLDYFHRQGLKIGLITNGREHVQRAKIDTLAIGRYFDAAYISEAVGVKKPNGAIFNQCLHALEVAPEEAWYVGDHPINDVRGSAEAGITPIWLSQGKEWKEEHVVKPAHTVQSLHDLIQLYESLHG